MTPHDQPIAPAYFLTVTPTTEIYTLSLHDALPILREPEVVEHEPPPLARLRHLGRARPVGRSEEHTSELQSQSNLVCRLLLVKTNHDQPIAPTKARTISRWGGLLIIATVSTALPAL